MVSASLRYGGKNYKMFETMEMLSDLAAATSRLGLLFESVGMAFQNAEYLQNASEYLVKAAELLNQVFKETMTVDRLLNLVQDFIDAGRSCYEAGDYETAGKYLRKATNANVMLQKQFPDIPDAVYFTTYAPGMDKTYAYLAEIYKMNGDLENAVYCEELSEGIAKYTSPV